MAHRKSHRHKRIHRSSKNVFNKTYDASVSVVKSTSNKYMPKVKSGLENVGSKVITTGKQSVPFLQSMTRKLFNLFKSKNTRRRRH